MNTYLQLTAYFITGLVCITLIDTLGAVASRKFNFKYTYLAILSFAIYIGTGYLLADKHFELIFILAISAILGLYDSTIGLKLSIRLKANSENIDTLTSNPKMVISMITMAIFQGFIGYYIYGFFNP